MKIQLLPPEQHTELLNIYNSFPELFLQNKGYECINRHELSEQAKEADKRVNEILKASIAGFSSFQNFCHNRDGEIRLRFQYNYGYDGDHYFIGVGYILLDELLNGFREEVKQS